MKTFRHEHQRGRTVAAASRRDKWGKFLLPELRCAHEPAGSLHIRCHTNRFMGARTKQTLDVYAVTGGSDGPYCDAAMRNW